MYKDCIDQSEIYDPDVVLVDLVTKEPCPLQDQKIWKVWILPSAPRILERLRRRGGDSNQVFELQDVVTWKNDGIDSG